MPKTTAPHWPPSRMLRRNPCGNDVPHRVLNAQEGFLHMLVEPALSSGGYSAGRSRFDQGRRLLQRLQGFLKPRMS